MLLDRLSLVAAFGTACSAGAISVRQSWSGVDSCPGYTASNVVDSGTTLTADLSLAGAACNAYGEDLSDLKLSVEYQTGKSPYRQPRLFLVPCLLRRPLIFPLLLEKVVEGEGPIRHRGFCAGDWTV